jgi:hypothetical protein
LQNGKLVGIIIIYVALWISLKAKHPIKMSALISSNGTTIRAIGQNCFHKIFGYMSILDLVAIWKTRSKFLRKLLKDHCTKFGIHLDIDLTLLFGGEIYNRVEESHMSDMEIFIKKIPLWFNIRSFKISEDVRVRYGWNDRFTIDKIKYMIEYLFVSFPQISSAQIKAPQSDFYDQPLPASLTNLQKLELGRFRGRQAARGRHINLGVRTISHSITHLKVEARFLKRFACKNLQEVHLTDWAEGKLKILKNCRFLHTIVLSCNSRTKTDPRKIPSAIMKIFDTLPRVRNITVNIAIIAHEMFHRTRSEITEALTLCKKWMETTSGGFIKVDPSEQFNPRSLRIFDDDLYPGKCRLTESELQYLFDACSSQKIGFQFDCDPETIKRVEYYS